MDAPFPMHPSFEARSGVPDRAFPFVSPLQGERMAEVWAALLAASQALSRARVLHLHHLTPVHDAAAMALPEVPVLTHLHGTELKMLDAIDRGEPRIAVLRRLVVVEDAKRGASCGRHDYDLTPRPVRGRAALGARP